MTSLWLHPWGGAVAIAAERLHHLFHRDLRGMVEHIRTPGGEMNLHDHHARKPCQGFFDHPRSRERSGHPLNAQGQLLHPGRLARRPTGFDHRAWVQTLGRAERQRPAWCSGGIAAPREHHVRE